MKDIKVKVQKYYLPQMDGINYEFIKKNLEEMGVTECKPINVSAGQLKLLEQDVDLNKIQGMSEVEDRDETFLPIWVSENLKVLDGRHRLASQIHKDGHKNGKIRCIRISADEKDGASMLRVIQDRWERIHHNNKNI